MYKFGFAVFLLTICGVVSAEEPLSEVTQVIELPNLTQKQIFDASKIWFAKSFNSANSVIQYEDAGTGSIIGKGNVSYPCDNAWKCMGNANRIVLFTLKIDTKDNKARLVFNDLRSKLTSAQKGSFGNVNTEYPIATDQENVESGLKKIITTYEADIKKSVNDSNW